MSRSKAIERFSATLKRPFIDPKLSIFKCTKPVLHAFDHRVESDRMTAIKGLIFLFLKLNVLCSEAFWQY